jgi:hypothetical protein
MRNFLRHDGRHRVAGYYQRRMQGGWHFVDDIKADDNGEHEQD